MFRMAGQGEFEKNNITWIYFFPGICFVSLSHFPVVLSFHRNFDVLHYVQLKHFLSFIQFSNASGTLSENVCEFFPRFFYIFFLRFIRIEFEFYLLQKINGLYRCHNPHKILSFTFQRSHFFFFSQAKSSLWAHHTLDIIMRKCVKRKYLLFGTVGNSPQNPSHKKSGVFTHTPNFESR